MPPIGGFGLLSKVRRWRQLTLSLCQSEIKMTQISLWYISEMVRDNIVNEFISSISAPGLSVSVKREEKYPIQAGLEWLAPTALIVFILKPYFQSFLSEMGKDHYNLLKKALKSVAVRLLGRSGPKIRSIAKGKAKSSSKYSRAFSIYVDVSEKLTLKLLFPTELEEEGVHKIIEAYSNFIEALYAGKIDENLMAKLNSGRVIGKTMLVVYDIETKELNPVDPIPMKKN